MANLAGAWYNTRITLVALSGDPGSASHAKEKVMEALVLLALVALMVVVAARFAQDRRVARRVPARVSRPRTLRQR